MRYLGLDLGSKTIGLALSDTTKTIASVYKTIYFKDNDYSSTILEIKKIVVENNVEKVILGFPKNMNNTIGERAQITTNYQKMLESEIGIPVILFDERLTSVISNSLMIEADYQEKKERKKLMALRHKLFYRTI